MYSCSQSKPRRDALAEMPWPCLVPTPRRGRSQREDSVQYQDHRTRVGCHGELWMMDSRGNLTPEQSFLFDIIDRNARAIALTGDSIFYFGELGMQEFETAKLMTGLLENGGFTVERGISGFPTGFCASYGSGDPVVAIHTEYD